MKNAQKQSAILALPAALLGAALLVGAGTASAADEEAAKAVLKRNDCTKCHAVDKTKKGPSYKKIAEKYKGKPDAEKKMTEHLNKEPMVKLEDGTEEKHKKIDADPKEIKNLIDWIRSL